jgi:hypothetical protein
VVATQTCSSAHRSLGLSKDAPLNILNMTGGQAVSVEENKALVRRFYEEVWDKGNTDFA